MPPDSSSRDSLGSDDTLVDMPGTAPDRKKPTLVAEPAELRLGDTLGRFNIVRKLGAGGMGIVYVALDPTLNRQVALKVLRIGVSGPLAQEQSRARLLREAQAMARLSHPNVITVHEVGTVEDQVFLVMELNDGVNLSTWVKTTRTWRDVAGVFVGAGRGLAAAHAANLVHRDFKPDNVLVARDGRVRVTDFGLVDSATKTARAANTEASSIPTRPRATQGGFLGVALTHTGAVLGTPAYMAPEQHNAEPADARTDQFSFCVSLFEALYGKRPFAGSSYRELVINNLDGNIVDRPASTDVPEALHALILRGLSPRRADRYPSMNAIVSELERLAAGPAHTTLETDETSAALVAPTAEPRLAALPAATSEQTRATTQSWMFIVGALGLAAIAFGVFWLTKSSATQAAFDAGVDDSSAFVTSVPLPGDAAASMQASDAAPSTTPTKAGQLIDASPPVRDSRGTSKASGTKSPATEVSKTPAIKKEPETTSATTDTSSVKDKDATKTETESAAEERRRLLDLD